MPTFVKNKVIFDVSDEQFQSIATFLQSNDPFGPALDFNKLVPMPETLNIEEGSDTDLAELLYERYNRWNMLPISDRQTTHPLNDPSLPPAEPAWCNDALKRRIEGTTVNGEPLDVSACDVLEEFVKTPDGAALLSLGRAATQNRAMYGARSWYDWACQHWGTKWNASDTVRDESEHSIAFLAPWSAPTPIIKALAEKFPDIDWQWLWASEDMGSSSGICDFCDGELGACEYHDGSEALRIYMEVYGDTNCIYSDADGSLHRYDCNTCPHRDECW